MQLVGQIFHFVFHILHEFVDALSSFVIILINSDDFLLKCFDLRDVSHFIVRNELELLLKLFDQMFFNVVFCFFDFRVKILAANI